MPNDPGSTVSDERDDHDTDDTDDRPARPAPRRRPFPHGRRWFLAIVTLSVLAVLASYAFESDPLEVQVTATPDEVAEFCRRYVTYQENAQLEVDLAKGPAPIEVARDRLAEAADVAPEEIRSDLDALVAGATELAGEVARIRDAGLEPGEATAELDAVVVRLGDANAISSRRVTSYFSAACGGVAPSPPTGESPSLVPPEPPTTPAVDTGTTPGQN